MSEAAARPFCTRPTSIAAGARLWELEGFGLRATVSDWGATLVSLCAPDREGRLENVTLGFPDADDYVRNRCYLGATVGRVANRIAAGRFCLDGVSFSLAANDPPNHLHGGPGGFDQRLWRAEALPQGQGVRFRYHSASGEEGYPATLDSEVSYRLAAPHTLHIEMRAACDAPTLVNLAHHSYFNLGGPSEPDCLGHQLALASDEYTPEVPLPRGQTAPVGGTPFDFRRPKPIGQDLTGVGGSPPGFDHNFWVRGASRGAERSPRPLLPVAHLQHEGSGRSLELSADQPGVQLYCGQFLPEGLAAADRKLKPYAGLCLETQAVPNAINVPEWAPQVVVRPGRPYRHRMALRFRTLGS